MTEEVTMTMPASGTETNKVQLAVFDFDGTCIGTSSPVILSNDLRAHKLIKKRHLTRLAWFGVRYTLHLPRKSGTYFQPIFTAFEGWTPDMIQTYLQDLYTREIRPRIRPGFREVIADHKAAGRRTVLLSATFKDYVVYSQEDLGVDYVIATEMIRTETGEYTGYNPGEFEGPAKVTALKAFADETFGEGNWELHSAYADHVSDIPLLRTAKHPAVISPSNLCRPYAFLHRWTLLDKNFSPAREGHVR